MEKNALGNNTVTSNLSQRVLVQSKLTDISQFTLKVKTTSHIFLDHDMQLFEFFCKLQHYKFRRTKTNYIYTYASGLRIY